MEPYWNVVERIIKESDIVLEILDARLISLTRNAEVERLIKEVKRPLIFVINKSDLVSSEFLEEEIMKLKQEEPDAEIVFLSTKQKGGIKILIQAIKKVFHKYGKHEKIIYTTKEKPREPIGHIIVGVLGYPNVGKSSIINRLCYKKKVKVSRKPGTTHGQHWINAGSGIRLIDSPGVIPLEREDEAKRTIICAKSVDRVSNPGIVAEMIINMFKKNKNSFENFYKIKMQDDNYETILELARKRGFLLKHAVPDEDRASKLIIKDWQDGMLRL